MSWELDIYIEKVSWDLKSLELNSNCLERFTYCQDNSDPILQIDFRNNLRITIIFNLSSSFLIIEITYHQLALLK